MRMIPTLLVALVVLAMPVMGQLPGEQTIDNFDGSDTLYTVTVEGGASSLVLTSDAADKAEGTAALKLRAVIDSLNPWGSYVQFDYAAPEGTYWDWSTSDSLSLWFKVTMAPSRPQYMVFRLHIVDQPNPGDAMEDHIYEHETFVDATSGWVNLRIPFTSRAWDQSVPDTTGFIMAPAGWNLPRNNEKLDADKIVKFVFALVTDGWAPNDGLSKIPRDSMEIAFDGFTRFGFKAVPAVFFNGKALNANVTNAWSWGGASQVVEDNAGPLPKTNAVKWTQAAGWNGIGYDFVPPFNLAGAWQQDSVKFKMKADAGVGNIRIQFESGPAGAKDGKRGKVFAPTADGQWHDYVFALADMTVMDGATNFDSAAVDVLGLMSEGTGVAGAVVYITDWWTGNPSFDVIAPDAPTAVQVTGGAFQNLVTWTDTPNEADAKYNVFYSETAFTTSDDAGVLDIPLYDLPAGTGSHTHLLRAPNTDQNVSFYYGVSAKDAAGNESPMAVTSSPVTTMAKGVPTISKTAPPNFVADGDLSEWAGMSEFFLSVVSNTAHAAPNTTISDDADLSVKAYVAFDADYLYVAYDVTDDVVSQNAGNSWEKDAPDLFIGLYDLRGKRHKGYAGGATPDYHFRFNYNEMFDDNGGVPYLRGADSVDYAFVEKVLTSGYTVEAKISLDSLAAKHRSGTAVRFIPAEGKRLPIDFSINDNDGSSREGILCYSVFNDDNSWQDMWRWTYTWIGNLSSPTSVEQTSSIARSYELTQNYPNPFNPSTEIRYSLEKAGQVTLRVYDVVGREVATLVNTYQTAGSYTASFNTREIGSQMASGVYFYRLDTGSFVSIKKMILLK